MAFFGRSPSREPRNTPESAKTVRGTPENARYTLPENRGGETAKKRQRSVDIVSYKFGSTPKRFFKGPDPSELLAQKENFMNHGKLPDFSQLESKKLNHNKGKGQIRFELFPLARKILETVREQYVNGDLFMYEAFGRQISKEEASAAIRRYLDADPILTTIKVVWSQDIVSSAVMMTRGVPSQPEKRSYTMVIRDDPNMPYLRERGIIALANHEVGTHFVRFYNDALQPWSTNRKNYKLRKRGNVVGLHTEEGLASLATLYSSNCKLLYKAALHYYAACMASVMGFRELYEHLQGIEPETEPRWRLVYRIKRSLGAEELGGYGKDQCYLAGAVKILLNRRKLNFPMLFSGKLSYDEVDKIKRTVRMEGCLKSPYLDNMAAYHKHLNEVASLNSVDLFYSDCLQCPTITSPSPETESDDLEPLDFLPITKERRDALNARRDAIDSMKEGPTNNGDEMIIPAPKTPLPSQQVPYQETSTFNNTSTEPCGSPRKLLLSLDDLPKTPFRCNYLRDLQEQVNSEEVTRRPLHSVKSTLDSDENQRKAKGQVLPDIRKQQTQQQQSLIRVSDSKPPILFQKVSPPPEDQKIKMMKKPKSAATYTYRSFKVNET